MKRYALLFLLSCFGAHSQISQKEFDEGMAALNGSDQALATATLANLESKYPNDAEVFFLRGFYNFRDGDTNAAMMQYSKAIQANPSFVYPFAGRAQLFAEKGMMDKAIADISEAIKLEPKNVDFLNTRANFYNRNNQYKEALEDMKTSIILLPNNIMGYYDAALFTKKMDPNADAEIYFSKAYANTQLPKFVTDVMYGQFLLEQGRFEEAKTKYEAALATNDNDLLDEDFHNAAIVFYKSRDYNNAIKYYNRAIELNPNNVNYRTNLASLYMDQSDWTRMRETIDGALSVNSEDPLANMYMAIYLNNTGNPSLGEEYRAKALRLGEGQ